MTATVLPTFPAPHALRMWDNETSIFIEIPSKDKSRAPYILAYPRTESGLQRALDFMANRRKDTSGAVQWSKAKAPEIVDRLAAVHVSNRKPKAGTEVQQAHAEAVLRAMKLIP